jgi:phosphomannomutase/phosphoglucomutase
MSITYNSASYFTLPLVEESGFREYDARWIIEPIAERSSEVQINYRGLVQLGNWIGRFLQLPENGQHSSIIVGHDFRRYAENAKNALVLGLLASGIDVTDIGLSVTPMAYFAQYDFSVPACAIVTASHNPNGWTGVKMGHTYSETFGPDRMKALQELAKQSPAIVSNLPSHLSGRYSQRGDVLERYTAHLKDQWQERLSGLPRLRIAVETGNGTAGLVFPRLLTDLGFDVVAGHVELDWDFPHFNPNPESIPFLRSVQSLVTQSGAEIGICIDGDGDRIGVIDDKGKIVFSDRVGLVIAKKLEEAMGPSKFVVDVKSTSLFTSQLQSETIWEKTGHSYIKSRVKSEGALAGFERSGHFFFNPPFGLGYDDAFAAGLMLLWIVCSEKSRQRHLSDLLAELPASHQSPNRQPRVPDDKKYKVVDEISKEIQARLARNGKFAGKKVKDVILINGIRLEFEDGSWFLIRGSSNTPNLVIVAETFDQDGSDLKSLDSALREILAQFPEVTTFDPLYEP